jgi:hypothetical protein
MKASFSIHNSAKRSVHTKKPVLWIRIIFSVNQDLAIQLFTSMRIRIQGAKLMRIRIRFIICRHKQFFFIKNVLYVGIRLGHKILLGTNAYSMD